MKFIIAILLLALPLKADADAIVSISPRGDFILRHAIAGDTSTTIVRTMEPGGAVALFVEGDRLNSLQVTSSFPYEIVSEQIAGVEGIICIRFYSRATSDASSCLMEVIVIQSDRVVRFATSTEFQIASDIEPDRILRLDPNAEVWMRQ